MEAAGDGFVRVIYYVTAVAIASCSYCETGFRREAQWRPNVREQKGRRGRHFEINGHKDHTQRQRY
jgi:hypothetical protein